MEEEDKKAKWERYYTENVQAPWDSGRPASQLVELLDKSKESPLFDGDGSQLTALELGCGTGASCVFLAQQGIYVVGVDIVEKPIITARKRAEEAGVSDRCVFLVADVFELPFTFSFALAQQMNKGEQLSSDSPLSKPFDFVFDCQCFHVLRKINEQYYVSLLSHCLRRGGYALVLTGNANEPEVGPSTLTREELLLPFQGVGFENVWIEECRFDMTATYSRLEKPPLAWKALFRKS